jgi:hypothetical protein
MNDLYLVGEPTGAAGGIEDHAEMHGLPGVDQVQDPGGLEIADPVPDRGVGHDQVEKSRPGHDGGDAPAADGFDQILGDLARRASQPLGDGEGDVGLEVGVLGVSQQRITAGQVGRQDPGHGRGYGGCRQMLGCDDVGYSGAF